MVPLFAGVSVVWCGLQIDMTAVNDSEVSWGPGHVGDLGTGHLCFPCGVSLGFSSDW